jgi:EF-P beta-lysylation protein EpmB
MKIMKQNGANCETFQANWQTELSHAITQLDELLKILELSPTAVNSSLLAAQQFALRVPRGYVARMRKADPQDPLLLQVLPLQQELFAVPGYTTDPLQEKAANPIPGLLHKYHDRVLLTLTGSCAINCRYCFRRHFPYAENNPGMQGWQQAIDYIASKSEIREVIYSGGDPLLLKDGQLQEITDKIAAIAHVKRLRIHSRIPIVLPERITDELLSCLTSTRLQPVMVVHCNHANEIDDAVINAMQKLQAAKIPVLNQTVLLKGVNDSVRALIELSESLFAAGIMPYYLHLLDKVQGAAHFEVSENIAKQLAWEMMQQVSGYLVPKLVCEKPGALAKVPMHLSHYPESI